MTLQERIESVATSSAALLVQFQELIALREKVRQAQEAPARQTSMVKEKSPTTYH
jgi:hypothetical protein